MELSRRSGGGGCLAGLHLEGLGHFFFGTYNNTWTHIEDLSWQLYLICMSRDFIIICKIVSYNTNQIIPVTIAHHL
jgi:hypothetical protein